MDIEKVLARADVHSHTDFDDTNGGLVTTWIISKSDKPLTKEEALVIERMKRNAGSKERIVFLPTPQ